MLHCALPTDNQAVPHIPLSLESEKILRCVQVPDKVAINHEMSMQSPPDISVSTFGTSSLTSDTARQPSSGQPNQEKARVAKKPQKLFVCTLCSSFSSSWLFDLHQHQRIKHRLPIAYRNPVKRN